MSRTSTSLLLLLLLMSSEDEEDEDMSFREKLELRYRRLRSGKIRRLSLDLPNASAFVRLFSSGQDDALVTLCGFDHRSFDSLHNLFGPLYDNHSPHVLRGRLIVKHNKKKVGGICSRRGIASLLFWLGPGLEAHLLFYKSYLVLQPAVFLYG